MRRWFKSANPRTRLASQQFEGGREKFYKQNDNGFSNSEPLPWQISIYIKSLLVQLGARGIIPRRLCTRLINLLGLRGV